MIAVGAHAEPAETSDRPAAGPEISDLAAGRLLMQAGRFEDALAFLKQARPADEDEAIERRFLLGAVYMRLGRPREAAAQYEAILAIRPDLTRVRLELARAHYAAGQDDKAKYHFQLSLGGKLPSSVESVVEGFLNAIDARKRWSAHVSLAALPESQRRAPYRQGNRADRGRDVPAERGRTRGVGRRRADIGRRRVLSDRRHRPARAPRALHSSQALRALGVERYRDCRQGRTHAALRWRKRFGRVTARPPLAGHERIPVQRRPWASFGARVSSRMHVSASTNVDHRTHDERDELDGWRVSVNPAVRYVLDSQTLLEVGPHFEAIEAQADHRASRLAGIGVGVSRAFESGITASLSASFQQRRYRADDPLFGMRRRDRVMWLSGRVLHRSIQLGGFAPYVGYSYERSRSNIPLHEYENHGAILGFTREF